jgi:tetratricopeptide (TPR) repeat protein
MTDVDPATRYREQIERLGGELDVSPEEFARVRTRVRDDIVALHREVDELIKTLQAVREEVRPLVDRYRELSAKADAAPPPVRVIDHLGSSTFRERGWSALAGADYDRAVTEMEKALALDPENLANLTILAWAHLRREEWDRARPLLTRVLEQDPAYSMARTCQGFLHLNEGRFAEAIESLSAVARDGTDKTAAMYANLYLGMVYAKRAMHRDAESFFLRALEIGPNLTEAYWELGLSRKLEGRDDVAVIAWRAGAANRYNPWGEKCRMAVEEHQASG